MKQTLAKLFVPLVAAAAGVGGYLADKGWIQPEDGAEVSQAVQLAVDSVGAALATLFAAIAAVVIKRFLRGRPSGSGSGSGNRGGSGGIPLVIAMGTAAALAGLPSCSHLGDAFVWDAEGRIGIVDPETGNSASLVIKPRPKVIPEK